MKRQCETCGAFIIDNCPICGAPQCCPKCCEVSTMENAIARCLANRNKITVQLDGNMWCAFRSDFKNLQESLAGFHENAAGAVLALLHAEYTQADALRNAPPSPFTSINI